MHSTSSSEERKSCAFLSLPVEIRLQIYLIILDPYLSDGTRSSRNIMLACRQTREEALPVWFEQRRHFRSPKEFSEWKSKANPGRMGLVKDVSFSCERDAWMPFRTWYASRVCSQGTVASLSPFTVSWWEKMYTEWLTEYEPNFQPTDMEALPQPQPLPDESDFSISPIGSTWDALTAASNMQAVWFTLWNHFPGEGPAFLAEQRLLLEMISATCPNMRELSLFTGLLPLDFLPRFTKLRLLRFTGYSTSSPEETLGILRSLKSLDKLYIWRHRADGDACHGIVTAELPKYISLTSDVIRNMNPLRAFHIVHMDPYVPSAFITVDVIRSLLSHADSLEDFRIESSWTTSEKALIEILRLISLSVRLKILYLDARVSSAKEKLDISHLVPTTVRRCEIAVLVPKGWECGDISQSESER
jgi:hypothetical protein